MLISPTSLPFFRRPGFTLMELIVVVAVIVVLAAIGFTVAQNAREEAELVQATQKMKNIGEAFVAYTADSGGILPLEDAVGLDDWETARKPENAEVWYNVLPLSLGFPAVADLADKPEEFYDESYPLSLRGVRYPKGAKKFRRPYFAFAINSRLQRRDENGNKEPGTLAAIVDHGRTVAFLERGLPSDRKVSRAQRGFTGGAKANPRAFAARHNKKGVLIFIDGHAEVRGVYELIERNGRIIYPQQRVIWTPDPEEDPN